MNKFLLFLIIVIMIPIFVAIFNFFGIDMSIYLIYLVWFLSLGLFYLLLPSYYGIF